MSGTPVTQYDVDSVRDVPIEEALNYLEVLERERRGLLKVGTILRAAQRARLAQEAAELQRTTTEQRAADAQVALDAIMVSVSGQQARLDGLTAEIGEAEGRLRSARAAEDDEVAAIERRLRERRTDADRALAELERTHRERRAELQAEEQDLVARIQALREELKGLAAKAGAL
jgi:chromosome segregation ATPase